ncbi:ABC transporter substrate-binding protein [Streptomyces thinghirensis]
MRESLLQVQPDSSVRPNLASSYKQANATTLVFTLRHDVTFWDGVRLTADDVVYSLQRNRNPNLPGAVYGTACQYVKWRRDPASRLRPAVGCCFPGQPPTSPAHRARSRPRTGALEARRRSWPGGLRPAFLPAAPVGRRPFYLRPCCVLRHSATQNCDCAALESRKVVRTAWVVDEATHETDGPFEN